MSYLVELLDGEITLYNEEHEPQEYIKPINYSPLQHRRHIRTLNQLLNTWVLVEEQINLLLSFNAIKDEDAEFIYNGLYKIFFSNYRIEHSNDMKSKNKIKRIKNQILPL